MEQAIGEGEFFSCTTIRVTPGSKGLGWNREKEFLPFELEFEDQGEFAG